MGELKNKIFLQYINESLDRARKKLSRAHAPKKGGRFMIDDITYEIGPCRASNGHYVFEISSKIPREKFPLTNVDSETSSKEIFFDEVTKIMRSSATKKPSEWKMESIVHTGVEELKERDYVNLSFSYDDAELYTEAELTKKLKRAQEKKIEEPDIPGIVTLAGKLVVTLVSENMERSVMKNVEEFTEANKDVLKRFKTLLAGARGKKGKTTTVKKNA